MQWANSWVFHTNLHFGSFLLSLTSLMSCLGSNCCCIASEYLKEHKCYSPEFPAFWDHISDFRCSSSKMIEKAHMQGLPLPGRNLCVEKLWAKKKKKEFREEREARFCPGLSITIIILALTSTEPEFYLENGRDWATRVVASMPVPMGFTHIADTFTIRKKP